MYKSSIDQVMNFRELEESDMKKEEKIKKLVSACQEFITEVEKFQNIEVPKNEEEIYEKVNILAEDISNTLVMLSYYLEQGDTKNYNQSKEDLASLFLNAGYLGEDLGDYFGEENFVEDIMGQY